MEKRLKKQLPSILFILAMSIPMVSGCDFSSASAIRGDGNIVSVIHETGNFDQIKMKGAFQVFLAAGNEPGIRIETDENLHELVNVDMEGSTLVISSQRDVVLRPSRMDIFVVYRDLRGIDISGACKIIGEDPIVGPEFYLDLSGAADAELMLQTDILRTRVAGAGNIVLRGHTVKHEVDLAGASNLNARDLITKSTSINLSGAGSANVYASENLQASLSGVGQITYYGEPAKTNLRRSGLGTIRSAQ